MPEAWAEYEKAAELGHLAAINSIGIMFENGEGVEADVGKAIEYYQSAIDAGLPVAYANLGLIYLKGKNGPVDNAKGRELFEQGLALGDVIVSGSNLAWMLSRGLGGPEALPRAIDLFTAAAELGEPFAMVELAVAYVEGRGVKPDDGLAAYWFAKGAALGNALGMFNIGLMYVQGRGVPRNDIIGIEWFAKGAAAGWSTMLCRLAVALDLGIGVAADPETGAEWLLEALILGNKDSHQQMTANPDAWTLPFRRRFEELLSDRGYFAPGEATTLDGEFDAPTLTAIERAFKGID